jgi:hypothetical protein
MKNLWFQCFKKKENEFGSKNINTLIQFWFWKLVPVQAKILPTRMPKSLPSGQSQQTKIRLSQNT